jgi:uncharacterized RmlC-like cupin family protein
VKSDSRVKVVRKGESTVSGSEGSTRSDILGPEIGSADLAVVAYSCEPGFRTGVHHHTADSVALITAGRALFRWGDSLQEEVELGPGDWLYVGADVLTRSSRPRTRART